MAFFLLRDSMPPRRPRKGGAPPPTTAPGSLKPVPSAWAPLSLQSWANSCKATVDELHGQIARLEQQLAQLKRAQSVAQRTAQGIMRGVQPQTRSGKYRSSPR